MTVRRIQLRRFEPQKVNFNYYSAYRMRVEVASVEGPDLDPYIFIYRKNPVSPYSDQGCDEFCAVIGPSQYATIPPVEPDVNMNYPFYRLDFIEVDFISQEQAYRVWELIKQETCILVEGMGKLTQLGVVEEHWCPAPPDDPGQPSQSVSESLSESM
jgi:hypothetical protein